MNFLQAFVVLHETDGQTPFVRLPQVRCVVNIECGETRARCKVASQAISRRSDCGYGARFGKGLKYQFLCLTALIFTEQARHMTPLNTEYKSRETRAGLVASPAVKDPATI